MKKILLFLVVSLVLFGGITLAQASSRRELVVSSSRQQIDYKNRIFIYEGKVKAAWEALLVEGDRLEVYLTKEDALSKAIIKGGVRITRMSDGTKKMEVTCDLATYTAEDDTMVMQGGAHYHDEMGNDLLAEKITIWMEEEKLIAEGSPAKAVYSLKGEEGDPASGESH